MKAKDVMTAQVVSVGPDITVRELASILLKRGISGVPVLDGEKLVGIVSEGDLIQRTEIGTASQYRSRWLRLFNDNATIAAEYVKSHAKRIRDVMTRDVISVTEYTPLSEVAAVLEKNRIKRVPVVRNGRLVGIITRGNLIRRLAAANEQPLSHAAPDDGSMRDAVINTIKSQPWSDIETADVTVTDGLVEFWGIYGSEEARQAARVAAENIPGVHRVEDHRIQRGNLPYSV
jgi:CBS domain-containing protein